MSIENRNLEPGSMLVAHYKKEVYRALVVAGTEGKVLYQLSPYDGREFKSPSALGTAVTGKSCNGWAFWSVAPHEARVVETTEASPEEASEPESAYLAAGAEFAQPPDRPRFHKVPNQKNVDPG
jgi:hypothetical protein